nr:hypothetical protein [Herpetosiphonaceae bacterium]
MQQQELEHTRQVLTARTQALEHALAERQQLETQLIAAQKLESLGTLAGGIAHDFNNLLTIILSSTDIARAITPVDDPVQDELGAVFHAATRASTLTRQLLGFACKQPQRIARIDLNAQIQAMHTLLERTLGPFCTLELELDPTLQPVQADAGHLEQVVINVVLNAHDAMPDGGVLSIATQRMTIDSTPVNTAGIPPGSYSVLTIQDTGSGMDAATCA